MLGLGQHIDQVGNLGVGAIARRIRHNGGVEMRVARLEFAHHFNHGIVFVMHAEHNLDRARIFLLEKSLQVAQQIRFTPVQRLKDGDVGAVGGNILRRLHETSDKNGGQKRIGGSHRRDRRKSPTDIRQKTDHAHSHWSAPAQILIRPSNFEGGRDDWWHFATIGNNTYNFSTH